MVCFASDNRLNLWHNLYANLINFNAGDFFQWKNKQT